MQRTKLAAVGLTLAALSTALFTGAGVSQHDKQPPGLDIAALVRSEKSIDHGRSKLVEFRTASGERKFYAKVGLRYKVSVRKTTDGSYEIGVKPYDPVTDQEADAMAKALRPEVIDERAKPLPERGVAGRAAPGWSSGPPPQAVTTGGASAIYSTGCLYITSEMYVKGCYERRRLPDAIPGWYLRVDTSEISGHHVGTYGALTGMKSRHDYDAGYVGTEVIKNRPAATISTGSCRIQTISIGYEGSGISDAVNVCPERISPYVRATYFHHAWSGRVWHDGDWRHSLGHSIVKARDGHSTGFDYRISAFQDDAFQNDSWVNAG
jgi:hypothetical protein